MKHGKHDKLEHIDNIIQSGADAIKLVLKILLKIAFSLLMLFAIFMITKYLLQYSDNIPQICYKLESVMQNALGEKGLEAIDYLAMIITLLIGVIFLCTSAIPIIIIYANSCAGLDRILAIGRNRKANGANLIYLICIAESIIYGVSYYPLHNLPYSVMIVARILICAIFLIIVNAPSTKSSLHVAFLPTLIFCNLVIFACVMFVFQLVFYGYVIALSILGVVIVYAEGLSKLSLVELWCIRHW